MKPCSTRVSRARRWDAGSPGNGRGCTMRSGSARVGQRLEQPRCRRGSPGRGGARSLVEGVAGAATTTVARCAPRGTAQPERMVGSATSSQSRRRGGAGGVAARSKTAPQRRPGARRRLGAGAAPRPGTGRFDHGGGARRVAGQGHARAPPGPRAATRTASRRSRATRGGEKGRGVVLPLLGCRSEPAQVRGRPRRECAHEGGQGGRAD